MHCHLLVLCLFLSVVCPQPIPNDNSVYVKCAAFGPLGHRTLHAWPCHTTFYGFLLCSFCVPSSQGEDAAIKILQDKILLYVCECMCSHTHSEQLVRGTACLNTETMFPEAVTGRAAGPSLAQLGFLDVNTDNIDLNKTNLPLRNSVLTPFHSYSLPVSFLSLFLPVFLSFFATLPGGGA